MKTIQIKAAYEVLKDSKLTKMDSLDKFKVVKILRDLKVISLAFDDFAKDLQEKLKGEDHEKYVSEAQQWQREGDKTTLSLEERALINQYLNKYNKDCRDGIYEEEQKEHELTFEKISEDAFTKFVDSNDFSVGQLLSLQEVIAM
jgi:hypothetical protein